MDTLNKVELIGRVIKVSKLVNSKTSNHRWVYTWLDLQRRPGESNIVKIRAWNGIADLLINDYALGSLIYFEGHLSYTKDDKTEVQCDKLEILYYPQIPDKLSNTIEQVKNTFNSLGTIN